MCTQAICNNENIFTMLERASLLSNKGAVALTTGIIIIYTIGTEVSIYIHSNNYVHVAVVYRDSWKLVSYLKYWLTIASALAEYTGSH